MRKRNKKDRDKKGGNHLQEEQAIAPFVVQQQSPDDFPKSFLPIQEDSYFPVKKNNSALPKPIIFRNQTHRLRDISMRKRLDMHTR